MTGGPQLDLDRCATEPIHNPEAIQPHGTLLALSERDLVVRRAAANLQDFIGVEALEAIGRPLDAVLDEAAATAIGLALSGLIHAGQNFEMFRLPPAPGRGPLSFSVHRQGGLALVELERPPPVPGGRASGRDLEQAFRREADDPGDVCDWARAVAEVVAEATRFDRVMIYRFLSDWTGEVIAEIRPPSTTAYLGLRFPASDIPPQARALYETNRLRLIADVDAEPVPLVPTAQPPTLPPVRQAADNGTGASPGAGVGGGGNNGDKRGLAPLDLSYAVLRAVSPIHLDYLRTMGVAATLTASLRVEGRLWGLIACHHRRPHVVEAPLRAMVARLADTAERVLARMEQARAAGSERRTAGNLAALKNLFAGEGNLARVLLSGDPGLLDLVAADGLALATDGVVICSGQTPPRESVRALIDTVAAQPDGFLATDRLADVLPERLVRGALAAGMLALVLPTQPRLLVAAFRREVVHEVAWGGDPSQPVQTAEGGRLGPRASFALWRETVAGRSLSWEAEAVAAWRALPAWLNRAAGPPTALVRQLETDISALPMPRQAEDPLLRALIDTLPGIVLVSGDPDGSRLDAEVTATNREFRRQFRIFADQFLGVTLSDAFSRIGLLGQKVSDIEPGHTVEVNVQSRSLGVRVIRVGFRPLLAVAGRDNRWAVSAWTFEDVTRIRRVEQALQSAREQALVASRAKTDFLSRVSHELRQPLNTIIGFSEIMRSELFGALGSPKYKEYIRHIEASGEHLLKAIGNILDLSEAGAGQYVLEEQIIDLDALIEAVCVAEAEQAGRAGIKLLVDLNRGGVTLQGDDRAVRKMIGHLLSNAFKFTPAGGMVTCRTRLTAAEAAVIEVQDTGLGIPDEYMQKMLDPEQGRAGRTVAAQVAVAAGGAGSDAPGGTRKGGSAPVGLAAIRLLADLHKAEVAVVSQAARGTTVRVTFPPWRTVAPAAP